MCLLPAPAFQAVPEGKPLKEFLQAADEAASPDGDPEKASLVFICKRFRLNYGKLSGEDKAALKRLAGKSDLLKNPIPQRGKNSKSIFAGYGGKTNEHAYIRNRAFDFKKIHRA